MKLRAELESDLSKIVDAIAEVKGVIAIILFGSRAKGVHDEYSDYDLMVIFEDDDVMWKNRRKLYENVGKLGLFTQVLTRSLREFWGKTEPTFLQNILEHGKILYLKYPLQVPAILQDLEKMAIIIYNLENLTQKEKMQVIYRLFGKQKIKGTVQKRGGTKLGDRCFMIPIEALNEITQIFKEFNIKFKMLIVYKPKASNSFIA